MEKVFKYAPDIIEQAAKSPLGLFALMIMAISILCFFFFRKSSERTRIGIFVLMFVSVVSFGVATIRTTSSIAPSPTIQDETKEIATKIDGTWKAEVTYDWGHTYTESFNFTINGEDVLGTASFLRMPKGILNGKFNGSKLSFITKTKERLGALDERRDQIHRYLGRVTNNKIEFIMQTEGGYSEHVPIKFTAIKED